MYQGHLPNGNAVQAHSAGDLYPIVMFQKGLGDSAKYCIMLAGFYIEWHYQDFAYNSANIIKSVLDEYGQAAALGHIAGVGTVKKFGLDS